MLCSIKLWMDIVSKSYKSNSIYKINIIINFLSGLLLIYVQVAVWSALYANNVSVSASLKDTITYVILNTILFSTVFLHPGESIGKSVQSGDVSAEMIRPIGLLSQHSAYEVGKAGFKTITYVVPSIIFTFIFFDGFALPANISYLLLFLVMMVFGIIIAMIINTIFGYTAFWLYNNWYVSWFETALVMFFGGTTIPLWFYPQSLEFVSRLLPFRYISYEAINCYLGKIDLLDAFKIISVQILWIIVLILLERFIWHRAQHKIVIQGG